MPALRPDLVEHVLEPDWTDRGALIGTLAGAEGPRVVAVATYDRLRDPARAEVSFAVADELQGRGIGTRLLEQLAAIAGSHGIGRFVAVVLPENVRMLGVFRDAGFDVARRLEQGTVELEFPLTPTETYRAHVDERDHTAVVASLSAFFEPESVAVLGASARAGSIGGDLFRNIVTGGFLGRAYPVNREGSPVSGIEGYASIEQIPAPIDLAVVCLPGGLVLDGCEAALRHGTRALCVISAGFAEIGSEGVARQEQLLALVRGHGARLIGPNCLGIASSEDLAQRHLRPARVSVRVDRLLVAERGPRSRPADPGGGPGPRVLVLRLDREQGRRLVERPARVLGGRSGNRRRAALPGVVRKSEALRPHRAAGRAHQADPRDEERHHRSGLARGLVSHGRPGRLGGRGLSALPPGGRHPLRHPRGAHRRRRALLEPATTPGKTSRGADQRGGLGNPVCGRLRRGRARAAAAFGGDARRARRGATSRRRAPRIRSTCSAPPRRSSTRRCFPICSPTRTSTPSS